MSKYMTLSEAADYISKKFNKDFTPQLLTYYLDNGKAPQYEYVLGQRAFKKMWLDKWKPPVGKLTGKKK